MSDWFDQVDNMYLKKHGSGDNLIVAICDEELIGKTLTQGNIVVKISENFYKGEVVSEEEIIESLKGATSANLFGEKSIECAIRGGCVDPACVIRIDGVPHAQIFRI